MNRLNLGVLALACGAMLLDIVLTGLFWSLETNPLATELGLVLFLALKVTMLGPFVAVFLVYQERLPRATLGFGLVVGNIYVAVLLANLLVLAGWWS